MYNSKTLLTIQSFSRTFLARVVFRVRIVVKSHGSKLARDAQPHFFCYMSFHQSANMAATSIRYHKGIKFEAKDLSVTDVFLVAIYGSLFIGKVPTLLDGF